MKTAPAVVGGARQYAARSVKQVLPYVPGFVWNSLDQVLGGRDALTPPLNLRIQVGRLGFVDPRRYRAVGDEFLAYFRELCDLRPQERVLDAGCGCGQMAVPLTTYLDQSGSYEGFDVGPELVDWCRLSISPQYPNFHFARADVYNSTYNPTGAVPPADYRFPYADDTFDFVFAKSLFTHMLPADTENYLREVSRVLRPNGRCLITFFLLNDESRHLLGQGASSLDFAYGSGVYRTIDPVTPERAVAYDEAFIHQLFGACRLRIVEPVRYGSWSGRRDALSYQDLVIARP
jgi:SAM-dependent methyltransferase